MIIQELKYEYTWGSSFIEQADVVVYYKADTSRAEFFVTVHDGTTLESGTFDVSTFTDVYKELTIFMAAFVVDFDAGKYNI